MPKIRKAAARDAQRRKAKFNTTTNRTFLHTFDRLVAERDRLYTQTGDRRPGVTREQTAAFWSDVLRTRNSA